MNMSMCVHLKWRIDVRARMHCLLLRVLPVAQIASLLQQELYEYIKVALELLAKRFKSQAALTRHEVELLERAVEAIVEDAQNEIECSRLSALVAVTPPTGAGSCCVF
jgi:hypothetical protein